MFLHCNAALTLVKRKELVEFIAAGSTLTAAADAFRVSLGTVRKWLRRFQSEGLDGLLDRSSRPLSSPRRTADEARLQIIALRRDRRDMRSIAKETGASLSTVSRILIKEGISRLRSLDPKEPDNRYEHEAMGDMLHVDIKKLARFHAPGHRATGDRSLGRSAGAGHDYLFVAVDDHSRLALVGVYPDEKKESAADFIDKALARMAELGAPVRTVLTDNGRCFTSEPARRAYSRFGCRHKRTRPYRPRTNGKAERFIQTLLREWAYAKSHPDSNTRLKDLGPWLEWYNTQRKHSGIQGQAPIQRLPNLLRNDT